MVSVLNIGNTHTQVAAAEGAHLVGNVCSLPTKRLLREPRPAEAAEALSRPCLASCVVPEARQRLTMWGAAAPLVFLHPGLIEEVDFSLVDASTLGADRMANAVAAVQNGHLPAIVLDCGTCITLEAVDGDHRFRGGAILPGRALLRGALHEHTGQLPLIPLAQERPPALGLCTRDAIAAGVDLGILGSVEKLIAESRHDLGVEGCTVLAVGGDAEFFVTHVPDIEAGGKAFTLQGLAAVAARLF